jgi:hypothetical protein
VEINVGLFYGFLFCNSVSGVGWILASKAGVFFLKKLGLVSCVCLNLDILFVVIQSQLPN